MKYLYGNVLKIICIFPTKFFKDVGHNINTVTVIYKNH